MLHGTWHVFLLIHTFTLSSWLCPFILTCTQLETFNNYISHCKLNNIFFLNMDLELFVSTFYCYKDYICYIHYYVQNTVVIMQQHTRPPWLPVCAFSSLFIISLLYIEQMIYKTCFLEMFYFLFTLYDRIFTYNEVFISTRLHYY